MQISNHLGQEVMFQIEHQKYKFVYKQIFKESNKVDFTNYLERHYWEEVYYVSPEEPNTQWNIYIPNFIIAFNIFFPRIRMYVNKKNKVLPE